MKNKLTTICAASAVTLTLLFALSCGSGSQNVANTGTTDPAAAKPTPSVATAADPCVGGTLAQKLARVKTWVGTKVSTSNGLNDLVNVKKVLSVDVTNGPGTTPTYLQLHIGGRVGGNANFLDLINIVEKVVKSDCGAAVIFDDVVWTNGVPPSPTPTPVGPSPAPSGTPLVPAIAAGRGFIWTGCEEGTIPCAGGCCPYPIHGEDANANSTAGNANK